MFHWSLVLLVFAMAGAGWLTSCLQFGNFSRAAEATERMLAKIVDDPAVSAEHCRAIGIEHRERECEYWVVSGVFYGAGAVLWLLWLW